MSDAEAILARLPHHGSVLERNLQILERMADGMDDAAADHAPVTGGSTLRWLLGHLLAYRDQMLRRLGAEPVWDEATAAPFKKGSQAAGGPALADMVAALRTQAPRLAAAFEGADALIANAALAPGWVKHDDRAFIQANIVGTDNTLRAAHDAGVRRIVLVSSVAVYRTRLRTPMDEDTPKVDPENPRFELSQITTDARYARTKAAAERLAWRLHDELDLQITSVRPGPIYGPRDHKVTARYGRWNDRRITVAPTARVPHVHALDASDAIAACLETPSSIGQAYNLGGTSESIYNILRTWRRIAGGGARLLPLPLPLGVRFDDRRAERELGFSPRPIEDGLTDCVAWYRQLVTAPADSAGAPTG